MREMVGLDIANHSQPRGVRCRPNRANFISSSVPHRKCHAPWRMLSFLSFPVGPRGIPGPQVHLEVRARCARRIG